MSVDVENISINVKTDAGNAAKQFKTLSGAMDGVTQAAGKAEASTQTVSTEVGNATKKTKALSDKLQNTIKNATKYQVLVHKSAVAETKMEKAFRSGKENAAWAARERAINATAAAAREFEKNQPKTPLSEDDRKLISTATQADLLRAKMDSLDVAMKRAFGEGNASKARQYREQIIRTQSAIDRLTTATKKQTKSAKVVTPLAEDQQQLIATASQIDLLQMKLESLNAAMKRAFNEGDANKAVAYRAQILQTQAAIDRLTKSTDEMASGTKKAAKVAKSATGIFGKFARSLLRIAGYRLLRTIIKSITSAFSEGLKNAYNFSKGISGTLAAALDSISTKSLTMKNQLGAALGSLLTAITPILLRIIELVRAAAQALSALFSALGGGQYLIATDVAKSWDQATGAAKKYKNTILGFDEINRLDEPSGGGGGGAVDASKMFEVGELPGWAQKLKDFIDNEITPAIEAIKFNIKDVLFNWDNLTPEDIARKVVTGLITFLGAATGFSLAGVPGALVGTLAGIVISGLINRATFNGDGKLGEDEVMKMIGDALFIITGGIIGFMAGGVGGALIGASIGAGIALLIDSISFSNNTKMTGFGYKLADAITAFTGAIIGFAFGGVPGAILGAAIGIGISLLIQKLTFGDKAKMFSFMPYLAKAISAFVGGVVGFVVSGGNPLGAVLGAAIGVNFDMIIQKILPKEGALDRDFVKKLAGAMTIVTGIVFGALVGGVPGAIIGATIGIALTLAINDVSFSDMKGKVSAAVAGINERLNLQVGKSSFSGAFASGGMIENTGSLFLAGEAGPEIVANMGSKTGVMNVDQMEAAVANGNSAVVGAVYAMANAIVSAIESKDTDISIDGESLARRLYKPMRDVSNQRGASLVMA